MIGVTPEEINPGHYIQLIHPDDEERLGRPGHGYTRWRRRYSRHKREVH